MIMSLLRSGKRQQVSCCLVNECSDGGGGGNGNGSDGGGGELFGARRRTLQR